MAESDDAIPMPAWFVRLAAGVLFLVIPWATWMTYTTIRIDTRLDASLFNNENYFQMQRAMMDHENRISKIERDSSI